MTFRSPHLILLLLSFSLSCNLINPSEKVPTFLLLDSVKLQSVIPTVHGSVSHKIKDVWVYYNRQLLGAYELPARVPILAEGNGEIEMVAGIYEDGLSGLRAKYPFYTVDTLPFLSSPGNSVHYTPVFRYRTTDTPAISYFIEDFEQGNSFIASYGDTSFVKTNNPADVMEGSWSSKLVVSDTASFGESRTLQGFTFPPNKIAYLELNYKSDIRFVLRVHVTTTSGSQTTIDLTGLNPSSVWNKIYFNFGGFAATYQNATFQFILSANLPSGVSEGTVLIDNFKIIHFN